MSEREKLSNLSVIGFDLDNTLYPSTDEMQERIRGKIAEKLSSYFSIPVNAAREMFDDNYNSGYPWSHSGSRTIAEIGRQFEKNIDGSEIVQQSLEEADIVDFIKPNPALSEMLSRLAGQFEMDMITGSRTALALQKLERIGIDHHVFRYLMAGGEHGGKGDGTAFKYWLNLRQASPGNMLYVGDNTRQDVEAPKKLKIRTCLVGKEDERADYCIKDILDLESILT